VDIVTVCLPHWLHERVAVDAARAGKHILIEKPLAMQPDECDRINEAVAAAGVKMMVGHSQHYSPFNILAKQHLTQGIIGSLVFQTVYWVKPLALAGRPAWGMDRTKGGGMLQMNGAHMIDTCRWLADSPIVIAGGRVTNDIFSSRVQADDSFIGTLRFANGHVANIAHAAYETGVEEYRHDVVGTAGQLRIASYPPNPGLWVGKDNTWTAVEVEGGRGNWFATELEDFINCVQTDRPVPIDGAYGREIVAAMAALEESTRTGHEVRLH
jgi:predicted dehydrogenase